MTAAPQSNVTSRVLLDALGRWLGTASGGGVLLEEVGINGESGASSRCDALYVGFTKRQSRRLEGFEVKISRADWLHELAQPEKGAIWQESCHRWWLVTVPGVAYIAELPEGWGLLELQARGNLKPIEHATTYEREPSWDVVRSMMARWDTQDRGVQLKAVNEARSEGRAAGVAAATGMTRPRDAEIGEARLIKGVLQQLEHDLDLGKIITDGDGKPRWGWGVTLDDLREGTRASRDIATARERTLSEIRATVKEMNAIAVRLEGES